MVENDAIMGRFHNSLITKDMRVLRFLGVANALILHCRYSAIASPLRCNRDAVTVKSRCRYGVTAMRFHRNGNTFWQKTDQRHFQRAEGYPFSALFDPAAKC